MIDTEALIEKALDRIRASITAKDLSGVKQVLRDLLETATAAAAAQEHRRRLEKIGEDKAALCRYWGELGITRAEAEKQLGSKLTPEQAREMEQGAFERRAEARALELGEARQGGKVLPWMTVRK